MSEATQEETEAVLEALRGSQAVVIGADDKFVIHISDQNVPRSVLHGMADACTRVFGSDRSVILVGQNIHINVVKGKEEQ